MYSSAPAMSHALEELVGDVDRLKRSLLFTHFRSEQGPISVIYRPSAPRASRNQIDAFIAKCGLLIVLDRPWMDWRAGAYRRSRARAKRRGRDTHDPTKRMIER